MSVATPAYRAMRYGITRIQREETPHGVQYVQAEQSLLPHPQRMTDKLLHWARVTPDRTFMARRKRLADGRTGDWEHLIYAQALAGARRIGQALLNRQLSADRPVIILSENSLEHAMLALGCMMVGVPGTRHVGAGVHDGGRALLPGVACLFNSQQRLRQTASHPDHFDTWFGVCHRCRQIRRGD